MKPPRYWQPLVETPHGTFGPPAEAIVKIVMQDYNESYEAALARIMKDFERCTYYTNRLYQVEVRPGEDGFVQLNIRRRDGAPIHDWRDLQQIKNEIVGEECEAVELYPAESRKVDTSNKYHLWACTNPEWRFPFGYKTRDVQDATDTNVPGLRQRPF